VAQSQRLRFTTDLPQKVTRIICRRRIGQLVKILSRHFLRLALATPLLFAGTQGAHALPGTTQTQIVKPGVVINATPLDFGSVIPGSVQSRIRILPTSDTVAVTAGNAIPYGGTVSLARFDVAAAPLTLVLINLPTSIQLTRVSGTQQMQLDQFQQNGLAAQVMGLTGQFTFYVGGRLHVGPSQATGHYQGTFNVTVTFL
jgi:spore coat protein U-like protein